MEGSQGGSSSPAPFLTKTYDMVDDPSTNSIVSWSPTNSSFVVWNQPEFARDLLPKYFKHNNFSSFVRQLNTYGFKKMDPDQWEFANEDFIRGQRNLLKNIHRRKPIHSHSPHNQVNYAGASAEAERQELEDKIKRLKQEKCKLMTELESHMQQSYGMEQQMQSLEEKLLRLEQRQRHLVDYLTRTIQRPGFLSNFMQHSDLQSKRRRLPRTDYLNEDVVMEGSESLSPEATREKLDSLSMHSLEMMESSLNSLENFFRSVSEASGDVMYFDNTVPFLNSSVVLTELHTSSEDTDMNLQSSSPTFHPSPPGDFRSSPEMAESANNAESPISLIEIHTDTRDKVSEIDVNSEPAVPEVDSSRDKTTVSVADTATTGVNDVFWEQFLTETPGSSDKQETQLQRKESNDNRFERRTEELGNTWRNRINVDHQLQYTGNNSSKVKT